MAMPPKESASRNRGRTPAQLRRRKRLADAAAKRQAKAKTAHQTRLTWLNTWRRKQLARIETSAGSVAQKRKSRNQINSKYNKWRRAENRKFKRITANNYSPTKLTVRTFTDIFEHYDIHRLFSQDLSVGGINDIVSNQLAGSTPYVPDEFAGDLEDNYEPDIPVLNLGVTTLDGLIEWVEIYDETGNRTWTAYITIPNSDQFYQVKARVSA